MSFTALPAGMADAASMALSSSRPRLLPTPDDAEATLAADNADEDEVDTAAAMLRASSFFARATNVPSFFATMSDLFLEYAMR